MKVALSIGHSTVDPGALAYHHGVKYVEYDLNKALFDKVRKLRLANGEWWQSDANCDHIPYPHHLRETVDSINNSDCD